MTAPDFGELLELVEAIPQPPTDADAHHLAETWEALNYIAATLNTHVREWSTAAAAALDRTDYNRREGFKLGSGSVVHHARSATEEWDGRGVLSALSEKAVDPDSGELVDVVPVDKLADVLPAIDGKSSKWRTTGLAVHGVDPDNYRRRRWGAPTIRKGPQR